MHLKYVKFLPEEYPSTRHYPFNLDIFHQTRRLVFSTPVTFFIGENGSGKSTLLRALSYKCGIHIWQDAEGVRFDINPYEKALYRYIAVGWNNGHVPGSFFSSEIFKDFIQYLDEWAVTDPEMLNYFGGQSLMTQSHGQSLMSYFKSRYRIKGLYLLDEPETALSPKSQVDLLNLLKDMGGAGHAQFVVATHSPILLACPGAVIYSFNNAPIAPVAYEDTDYYRLYKDFMENPSHYLSGD
jgi:predicted ATPase